MATLVAFLTVRGVQARGLQYIDKAGERFLQAGCLWYLEGSAGLFTAAEPPPTGQVASLEVMPSRPRDRSRVRAVALPRHGEPGRARGRAMATLAAFQLVRGWGKGDFYWLPPC